MIPDQILKEIDETLNKSTGTEWYSEENNLMYQLFAETGMMPLQILKAPKQSIEYAEYWPNRWDDKLITNAKTWLILLYEENKKLREQIK